MVAMAKVATIGDVSSGAGLKLAAGYGISFEQDSGSGMDVSPQTDNNSASHISIRGPRGTIRLPATVECGRALALLSQGPCPEDELQRALGPDQAVPAREHLRIALEYLARLGGLERVISLGDTTFAVLEPLGEYYRFDFVRPPSHAAILRLVRFCLMRPDDGSFLLESPVSRAQIRLFGPLAVALVAQLATARDLPALRAANPDIPSPILTTLLSLMLTDGFVTDTASPSGPLDETLPLKHWDFHDLYFHSRSRRGRHNNPAGATFRFRGKTSPPPAIKQPMSREAIPLPRPDIGALMVADMSVTAAIETRSSVRQPAPRPLAFEELGHFLYRSARVRGNSHLGELELTNRPYPSGGASYELEIYLVADQCQGLLNGIYHYQPHIHALEPLVPSSMATERLLYDAFAGSAGAVRPSVLFVITARFQRVSWKYSSIAYATILKNVGALFQTMYLVATAMRLGPCAVGAGDSDLFSLTLGTDYYEESPVGEFMLGAKSIS